MRHLLALLWLLPLGSGAQPSILDAAVPTPNADSPAAFAYSAGSNRWMIVYVRHNDGTDSIDTMTCDGTSLTKVTDLVHDSAGNDRSDWFLFNEAQLAAEDGNCTLAAGYTPGTPVSAFRTVHIVLTLQDADQTTPSEAQTDTCTLNSNADPMTCTLTGVANSLGLAFCSVRHGNGVGSTHDWTTQSWTEGVDQDSNDLDVTVSNATKALAVGANTVDCNPANTGPSAGGWLSAMRFDAAAATGPPINQLCGQLCGQQLRGPIQ